MNTYKAFYNGNETEVQAATSYAAQLKAIEFFRPKKSQKHLVSVHLIAINNKEVIHTAVD